jgi:hypothetical protein
MEEHPMSNKERFFRFGLDLQLEEVDPPKDMNGWTGEPGFVEENMETVLSFNLDTLLPDEEWLVIGRQETNVPDPDLTAITNACDLIFFEIKKDAATAAMADQNLGYWIRTRAERYPYYLSRYLRLQCNREWVEPVRLLGLAKGDRFDKSGPVKEQNLQRLRDNNDTNIPDEQFLSLGRRLLLDGACPPLSKVANHKAALVDAFREKFGFGDHELLRTCLGKSLNLAFVAPDFSNRFLENVRTLWKFGVFSYLFKAHLYRHKSDSNTLLLSFKHFVSDDVMSQRIHEARRFLNLLKEELFELEARELRSGPKPFRIPLCAWAWSYPTHDRKVLRFHPRNVSHYGDINLKNKKVLWMLEWMKMGARPGIVSNILEQLRAPETELPAGVRPIGRKGRLEGQLEIRGGLNRSTARHLARDVYEFLKYTFDFYDPCGLWEDPYDAYGKPG